MFSHIQNKNNYESEISTLSFSIQSSTRLLNEIISSEQHGMHGGGALDADLDLDRLKLNKLKQYMSMVIPMVLAKHDYTPLPEWNALLHALRSAIEIYSNESKSGHFNDELFIVLKQFRKICDLLVSRQENNEAMSSTILKEKEAMTTDFLKGSSNRIKLENDIIPTVRCISLMALNALPQDSSKLFSYHGLNELCQHLAWMEKERRPLFRDFMHEAENVSKIQKFFDELCKNDDPKIVARKFLHALKSSGRILSDGYEHESFLRLSLIIKYFGHHIDSTTLSSIFLERDAQLLDKDYIESLISFPHNCGEDKFSFLALINARLSVQHDTFSTPQSNDLPLLLYLWLKECSQKIYAMFIDFNLKCKKINAQCDVVHQCNLDLLFIEHFPAITQTVRIMGSEGIALLRSKIAHSLQPLLHFCENMVILPDSLQECLRKYFEVWQEKNPKGPP